MYRSYRMRYHTAPPNPLIVDPTHQPTRIIVNTMTGKEHILFTERDGENFLDVKRALLPYVEETPALKRLSLSLKREDGSFDIDVDNARLVPSLNGDVTLELLIKDLTMNAEQQALIDRWSRLSERIRILRMDDKNYVDVCNTDVDTPDKMEAFLFYLENNSAVEIDLRMMRMNIHLIIPIMMTIISKNIPVGNLMIHYTTGMSADETREFFEKIGQINTIHDFKMYTLEGNMTYRMNDLANLIIQSTSLRRVEISGCNIILERNTRLSHVLTTLDSLHISGRYQGKLRHFTKSFQDIIRGPGISMTTNANEISLFWNSNSRNRRNPNL